MAKSRQQLARILKADKDVAVRMANLNAIPDTGQTFQDIQTFTKYAMNVTKNVTAHLNGLTELARTRRAYLLL